MSGPCAGDSEDALRFLQQQHMHDSTLVSSVYLDDPDFQTYRSRFSSAAFLALFCPSFTPFLLLFWPSSGPLLALFCPSSGCVITTCSMCMLALHYALHVT